MLRTLANPYIHYRRCDYIHDCTYIHVYIEISQVHVWVVISSVYSVARACVLPVRVHYGEYRHCGIPHSAPHSAL